VQNPIQIIRKIDWTKLKPLWTNVKFLRGASILLAFMLVISITVNVTLFSVFSMSANMASNISGGEKVMTDSDLLAMMESVVPEEGVDLKITWGDIGQRMIEKGVIDEDKLEKLYEGRGGMSEESEKLLYESDTATVIMNRENSKELLNLLWAFGLSNKSSILETGLMTSYDGKEAASYEEAIDKAGRMAATGGWSLSAGNPMDHYSAHEFVVLAPSKWELVEKVASHIYRPCCNNPTHFPDCNHGMAMLGLLELLAANGATEEEMFDTALAVNSYWFPDTYLTIAEYMMEGGIKWKDVDSKTALSAEYSSGSGFRNVLSAIEPVKTESGGGGCGV